VEEMLWKLQHPAPLLIFSISGFEQDQPATAH
jgi:hypothetical protein